MSIKEKIKVTQNEKKAKNYMGFLIHKIYQIFLKHFVEYKPLISHIMLPDFHVRCGDFTNFLLFFAHFLRILEHYACWIHSRYSVEHWG